MHCCRMLLSPLLNALEVATSEYGWLVFLSGESHWARPQAFAGCSFHSTDLPVPDVPVHTAVWERCLKDEVSEAAALAYRLGGQFQLTPGQFRGAVDLARNRGLMKPERLAITASDLAAACRENSGPASGNSPSRSNHTTTGTTCVSLDKLARLRAICGHCRHRYRVFGDWGFGRKLALGGDQRLLRRTIRDGQDDGRGGRCARTGARSVQNRSPERGQQIHWRDREEPAPIFDEAK